MPKLNQVANPQAVLKSGAGSEIVQAHGPRTPARGWGRNAPARRIARGALLPTYGLTGPGALKFVAAPRLGGGNGGGRPGAAVSVEAGESPVSKVEPRPKSAAAVSSSAERLGFASRAAWTMVSARVNCFCAGLTEICRLRASPDVGRYLRRRL